MPNGEHCQQHGHRDLAEPRGSRHRRIPRASPRFRAALVPAGLRRVTVVTAPAGHRLAQKLDE
jgi:hypothetical protein